MPLVSVPTGAQLITDSLKKEMVATGGRKKKEVVSMLPPSSKKVETESITTSKRGKPKKDMTEYTSIVLADSDKPEKELKKPRGRKPATAQQ